MGHGRFCRRLEDASSGIAILLSVDYISILPFGAERFYHLIPPDGMRFLRCNITEFPRGC
jgi:hypothetical protein